MRNARDSLIGGGRDQIQQLLDKLDPTKKAMRSTKNTLTKLVPAVVIWIITMSALLIYFFVQNSLVEEKFPQEIFRVFSEMRFLAKIRVAILDFVGYVDFLVKFSAKLDFRV